MQDIDKPEAAVGPEYFPNLSPWNVLAYLHSINVTLVMMAPCPIKSVVYLGFQRLVAVKYPHTTWVSYGMKSKIRSPESLNNIVVIIYILKISYGYSKVCIFAQTIHNQTGLTWWDNSNTMFMLAIFTS